jgi:hypothetical protein
MHCGGWAHEPVGGGQPEGTAAGWARGIGLEAFGWTGPISMQTDRTLEPCADV